eukprot:3280309-Heterocapsa_arctica.AAC.1
MCLFKLKRILDQEQTQKQRQGWEEHKLIADLAEAMAWSVATEEKEARKRQEQGIAQPQASEEERKTQQEEETRALKARDLATKQDLDRREAEIAEQQR